MTGFHAATVSSQPVSCERGTYDVVRNRNGKNRRNATVHGRRIAGLERDRVPEAGEGQAPERGQEDEHDDAEQPGLEAHAEHEAQDEDRHASGAQATATSATMWPSRIARRRTGVSSRRSK